MLGILEFLAKISKKIWNSSLFYYEIIITAHALAPLTYSCKRELEPFSEVLVELGNKQKKGYVYKQVGKPSFKCKEILSQTGFYLTAMQIQLLEFISSYYSSELGVAAGLFEPFCESKNILDSEFAGDFSTLPELSELQNKALDFSLKNDVSLIFGDTGSGKSEIYISAIAKTLKAGKQALLLMPEIALTPQMQKRLEKYFSQGVGLWHSKIAKGKKERILNDFKSGKIRLIAGARSALFLPFTNLGLIIVDEEHDESYKNASKPCYNARDLAIWLAKNSKKSRIPSKKELSAENSRIPSGLDYDFEGIRTILGSATPSVVSYHKIPHFRLKGTFFTSSKEFLFDHSPLGLSNIIISHLAAVLEAKKQAVIFLPTRGNFKVLLCKDCGKSFSCPFCAVNMSLHKNANALKCHYCGFSSPLPSSCEHCGGSVLQSQKIGTSELKLMLESALPKAKIAKFDRDEITTAKKLETLLKDFNEGKIDILVGTQMLSKGHDYHNVELAVILGLDEHLAHADFRASEKTLALAMQIAGRAGRASHGKVIIQTAQQEFFESYLSDFELFIKDELELREPLYPPFARLSRILISHANEQKAARITEQILAQLKSIENLEIIGHGKASIAYIASKFRYAILLRAYSHSPLLKAGNIALAYGATADIDPFNFN